MASNKNFHLWSIISHEQSVLWLMINLSPKYFCEIDSWHYLPKASVLVRVVAPDVIPTIGGIDKLTNQNQLNVMVKVIVVPPDSHHAL